MSDWLDPQRWLPPFPVAWNPLTSASFTTLAGVLDDLTRLVVGRVVRFGAADLPVTGEVTEFAFVPMWPATSVTTTKIEIPVRIRLAFGDVDWAGHRLERLEVEARQVTYVAGRRPRLRSTRVRLLATAGLGVAGELLEERVGRVELVEPLRVDVSDPGSVQVDARYGRIRVRGRLVPRVTSDSVVAVVRELRLAGCRVPVPRQLRPAVDVPADLGPSTRFVSVVVHDDDRLSLGIDRENVEWAIDLRVLADRFRQSSGVIDVRPRRPPTSS